MTHKLVINEKEYEIQIEATIPLSSQDFVTKQIVNGLFENDEYSPVRYTYVFWREVLRAYTNLDVDMDEDVFMDIIDDKSNGLIAEAKETIKSVQLDNIENAVDELIAARLSKSEMDMFWADARTLLKKVDDIVSTIDPESVQKVVDTLAKLDEKNIVQTILALQKKKSTAKGVKQ